MIVRKPFPPLDTRRAAISALYRADESDVVESLIEEASVTPATRNRITERATTLVSQVRETRLAQGGIDAFMSQYELSSEEGVVLMCVAEALLRIPDAETADKLIEDKIVPADWQRHLGASDSLFVNASTWALMLTGRVLKFDSDRETDLGRVVSRFVKRSGEPVIRRALFQAMHIMGRQFVLGRTIKEALREAREAEAKGYRYSYDMLGEAARTAADAERYFDAYLDAIDAIGTAAAGRGPIEGPGISIKLSALHPRYEYAQHGRVMDEVVPRLRTLAARAKDHDIGVTVDAEEADRLDLSLDVIEAVSGSAELSGWDGFGLALQAYQKRATAVVDWLADLARRHKRRLMVRLVKGAYWDTEIKRAQERGLDGYPVFTRKASTDVSFIACAKRLLETPDRFYPQFATHNALTLATVVEIAGDRPDFEFQCLHGMGDALYDQIVGPEKLNIPARIYAPVGSHEDLLPYLVRRLLENGANTSFVNRIVDEDLPIETLVRSPVTELSGYASLPHPQIPLPVDLFAPERNNSSGLDLSDPEGLRTLDRAVSAHTGPWTASPIIDGAPMTSGVTRTTFDPSDHRRAIGEVVEASAGDAELALSSAVSAFEDWSSAPADERASCLEKAADLLETRTADFIALCGAEAGKTLPDALGEVREAADFCRYYAMMARREFSGPEMLGGPTGEANQISLHGRGVFATLNPWNFPLAIFMGQTVAALAAGNAVIAKPAEQTPLVAAAAVRLLHDAGVPGGVLHLLPGSGHVVGAALVADPRVAGVAFTGSTETARVIAGTLAAREGPMVPLIAETGGQNALIVDSSALPEQVVTDVLASAYNSAGQRCSALRVLFVQADVADRVIEMIAGAMHELVVGPPCYLETDVGPVIEAAALDGLERHSVRMSREGHLLAETPMPVDLPPGTYFAPRAFEIDAISRLEREVFGPILHIVRYESDRLDSVIDAINRTGYGLTLGIHSRIDKMIDHVLRQVRVGNAYVNRNQIGAVVGVQPFGGEGLSGTGPKAGGPRYLHRFATERVVSINTTAAGGNAALMTLDGEG